MDTNLKNCILYLVRTSEEDLINLNKSLSLVYENVLPNNPGVDIVLFHEESFVECMHRVLTKEGVRIVFQLVNFPSPPRGTPDIFPHPIPEQVAMGNLGFSVGYRHMCHFFSGGLYDQPIMKGYKYYLRLDTDSYVLTPINYNIFEKMESGNYKYGFIPDAVQTDHPAVTEGLWDFAGGTVSGFPKDTMYYSNFEIGEVEFFFKGLYYVFFKRIEANGGIYTKRWGDGPIKWLGVNLFTLPSQRLEVRGFFYQHGHIYNLTKN